MLERKDAIFLARFENKTVLRFESNNTLSNNRLIVDVLFCGLIPYNGPPKMLTYRIKVQFMMKDQFWFLSFP